LTPWDEIYFRLSSSDFRDERWSAANFGMQRTKDVAKAIKWIEKYDLTRYNIESISTAKLGAVVVSALAGKKAKATAEDFLPFDTRKIDKENGVTAESLDVLRHLLKTRRINGRLLGMLAEEIKTASLREEAS
jgi:hypothetical protein